MRASLDIATDPWGIKVNRVELKNIIPPQAIQDAMEKQMKAERERRLSLIHIFNTEINLAILPSSRGGGMTVNVTPAIIQPRIA